MQSNDVRHFLLGNWITAEFSLPQPPTVSLVRSYTNDVYRVEAGHDRFALKIYGAGWRTDPEIRYEIDLLHHLSRRGVHVALPVPARDGADAVRHVEIGGVLRQAVVFAWAAGAKPSPPFTPEAYRRQGLATATLHQAADGFTSPHPRAALDLDTLVNRPLATIDALPGHDLAKAQLQQAGDYLRGSIGILAATGLDWGPCHGDLTFDNVHHAASGETIWYDFDSGGPGWRAIDLQGWAASIPAYAERWHAFLTGYQSIRPLGANDIAAAPYLTLAQDLWGIQVDLERRVIAQGSNAVSRLLVERGEQVIRRARALGFEP